MQRALKSHDLLQSRRVTQEELAKFKLRIQGYLVKKVNSILDELSSVGLGDNLDLKPNKTITKGGL